MTGIIVAFDVRKGWGFVESNTRKIFFHIANSPELYATLGMAVEFELAPPFKLGQPDQAVNLREVQS